MYLNYSRCRRTCCIQYKKRKEVCTRGRTNLRFSVSSNSILFNLSDTDVIKGCSCHLSDGIHEVAFPHGVQVGEDGVLEPDTPTVIDATEVGTSAVQTKTLQVCVYVCVFFFHKWTFNIINIVYNIH